MCVKHTENIIIYLSVFDMYAALDRMPEAVLNVIHAFEIYICFGMWLQETFNGVQELVQKCVIIEKMYTVLW